MTTAELSHINPLEVRRYLKGTGWEATQSRRPHIELFNAERNGFYHEITLPLNREFKDYPDAMSRAIKQIAEIERRSVSDVISSLITPMADIIKFRRVDTATENGTIPFDEGFRLFENAKKALYAVVCDLLQPALYHKRLSIKAADAFIERCSFGQTERGSYIATIVCPFIQMEGDTETRQLSLFDELPDYADSFTRRVTTRLMKSLDQVHQAIENDQLNAIQQVDNPADVISGNLLEALLDLNGSDNTAEIEISTKWAPLAPLRQEETPAIVRFNRDDFSPLERAVERIQDQNETTSRQGVFVGRISLIQAEPNIEERTNGEIILNTVDVDGKLIKPKMVVSPEELDLAIRAIREGLNVRVRGVLNSRRRTKTLEYTTLEIID